MSTRHPPRRPALRALLLPLLFVAGAPGGCVTAAMWDELDDTRGERVAAVVLTPVTVAIDAALIAGYVYASADHPGGCGYHHCCR